MINIKFSIPVLLLALFCVLPCVAKKTLGHDDFDSWKRVRNYAVSKSGEWAAFATVPQEGDALLTFYNSKSRKRVEVARGYNPEFSADGKYAVALIKPFFADTRNGKIAKKKDLDLPQDSLAIISLEKGSVEKVPCVTNFKIGKKGGEWLAYTSVDTAYAKLKVLKEKKAGKPLVLRTFSGSESKLVNFVDKYVFSNDGKSLALTVKKAEKDTVTTNGLGVIFLPDTSFHLISRDMLFYGDPVFNESGTQIAFTASNDSTETGTRKTGLFLADLSHKDIMPLEADEIDVSYPSARPVPNLALPHSNDPEIQAELEQKRIESLKRLAGPALYLNQYSQPQFSFNGKRLIVGVAPLVAPDDTTLVDFERPSLDIWRWDAPYNPPMENKMVKDLRQKTFPVVIDLATKRQQLIYRDELSVAYPPDRWDGDYVMVADPTDNIVERQWNYYAPETLWSVNLNNGDWHLVTDSAPQDDFVQSPSGRFILWFRDRNYYAYDCRTGKTANISEKCQVPLWDVTDDRPSPKVSIGIASWSKDDAAVLVYDNYDIWSLDPTGEKEPVCFTKGEGRKKNLRFRYKNLDKERRYLSSGDFMLLDVFDYCSKENGLATMKYGAPAAPAVKTMQKAQFTQMQKAEKANVFTYQFASFEVSPNIWISTNDNFSKTLQLTDANPQQKDYSWGRAQLFKWRTYRGEEAEGVLYLPEDFDSSKEYPMLSVFYETSDEDLYRHYTMEPSWSWVNYPFYVSRGYVIFVPSIHYNTGLPGESCYDYVCSGVEAVCDAYPNIDRKRIGIDGQSWGGYQTAYLITRTNMFACAGSGAPVANMTSAFGGIRWGTGDSRQGQYEMGQSRIGRNLWEAPELYIANSPIFRADKVNTPLLIMHNDQDGAVPWYQGIELFMGLRRLGKPVWMLQYNGEDHNLKERRNRKDITKRLQQFFDHYLKGEPMPEWMTKGIPAIRKGQELGY